MVIPHQANIRIIEMVRNFAKLSPEQMYVKIDKTGNTSSATIPVALDEANRKKLLKKGDILGMTAFGGGLTYGAAVIEI
jgi:3-oxoacyl-[acyl-carrier-protein] synthase-3